MVTKKLTHNTPQTPGGCINLYNDSGRLIAGMIGPHEESQELAGEITERYNAPLIILGRSEELHLGAPMWHVIHEGRRTQMRMDEITDLTHAMEFVEDSK